MIWDWGLWLLVDAALLVAATGVVLTLFCRDLFRGMRERGDEKETR